MSPSSPDGGGRLAGRRILITGAASGIGRATAGLFASEGAHLALVDLDGAALAAVARPGKDVIQAIDLTDFAAAPAVIDGLAERIGGLDGVVNCAGTVTSKLLDDLELADWQAVVGLNLTAPYVICRSALPWLRRSSMATIANVASAQALMPNVPGLSSYAASKAGLIAFTKALAAELAPRVRANALCPGITATPIVAPLLDQFENPDDAPFAQNYALKRVARPIEMARALLFLTSPESSYMTGTTLVVDGGRTFY